MYVRKTETLVNAICSKIRTMENQAVAAHSETQSVTPAEGNLFHSMVEVMNNAIWSDAPDLKDKVPNSWLQHYDDVILRFKNDEDGCFTSLRLDAPRGDKFSFPLKYNSYYRPEVDIHPQHYNEAIKKWAADEKATADRREELEDQFDTVLRQIVRFMGQHASLNAAVKAMPEIELYVPEEYLTKLRAPTAPRQSKATSAKIIEDLNIDVNALTSAAIAHRITVGNK